MHTREVYCDAGGYAYESGGHGSSAMPATAAVSQNDSKQCDPTYPASKDLAAATDADVSSGAVRMEAVVQGRTPSILSSHISSKHAGAGNAPKHPNSFHPYKRSFHSSFHASNASPHVQIMPHVTLDQETNSSRSIMERDDSLIMSPQAADDSDAHMFAASPVAGDDEELGNAKIPAPLHIHDQPRRNQFASSVVLPHPQIRSRMQPAKSSESLRSNPLRIPGSNARNESDLREPPGLIQKADPASQCTPASDPAKIQDAKDLAAFAAWVTLRLIGRRWSLLMEQKTAAAASAGVSAHSNSVYGVSNSPGVSMSSMHSSYIPSSQLSAGVSMSGPGSAAVGNFSTFASNIQPSAYVAGSVAGSLYIPSSSPNRFQQHQQKQTHTPIINRQMPPTSFPRVAPSNGQRPLLNRFGAAPQNVHAVMGYRDDRIDSVTTIHSVGSQRCESSYFQQQQPNSQYAQSLSTPLIPQVNSRQNSTANLISNVSIEPLVMGATSAVPEAHCLSPNNSPNLIQGNESAPSARFASPASGLQQSPSPGMPVQMNDVSRPQVRNVVVAGSSASTIVSDAPQEFMCEDAAASKSSASQKTTLPPLNQILDAQNIRLPSLVFESNSSLASGSGRPLPPFGHAPRYASSSQYSAATLPLPRHIQVHGRSQSSYTTATSSSMLSSPNPAPQFLQPMHPQQQQQQQQPQSTRHTLPPSYISHYTSRLTRLATLTLLKTPTPPHTTLLALHLLRRLISTPKPLPTRISTPTRMLLACLMIADSLFGGERGVPSLSGLKDGGDDGDTTAATLTDGSKDAGGLGFIAGMKKDVLVALGFHLHGSVVGYTEWMQTLKDLLKDGGEDGGDAAVTGASVDMKRRTRRILDDLSVGEGRLGMDWKW
ncbi:hypothetical protein BJ741DRAFT_651333 [Chytriomyces cf. hyalinus JEL632]|nr:hypothetical protein BJ741DRAFT_651333 [Chytriomyces cf. hyalinus JEL632]